MLLSVLTFNTNARAQQANEISAAPVPTPILAAKSAFISNGGTDCYLFSGGPDRAYNQFFSAMTQWKRYELLPAPAGVDLVFELQFSCPSQDPHFRLVIRDLRTSVILWGFTEHATFPSKHATYDHNFDLALANLVVDVKKLAGQPASSPESGHK